MDSRYDNIETLSEGKDMALKPEKQLSKNIVNKRNIKLGKRARAVIAVLLIVLLLTVILICSLSGGGETLYDFGRDAAQGIDVSEHNGEIDWQAVGQEADFVFIRVGYRGYGSGAIKEDERARENLKGAQKAGIPYGVYFYSQAVNEEEAEEEADFVIKILRRFSPSLPVVIDFEYPTDADGIRTGRLSEAGLSRDDNTKIINAFCSRVSEKDYTPGVYASSSVLAQDIDTQSLDSDIIIWAADYSSSVGSGVEYDIHQYSRTGSCSGVSSKNVDLNYYYSKRQKG